MNRQIGVQRKLLEAPTLQQYMGVFKVDKTDCFVYFVMTSKVGSFTMADSAGKSIGLCAFPYRVNVQITIGISAAQLFPPSL